MRELKGFERVSLAPGEKKTVRFRLGPDTLGYWSTAQRKWLQDAAPFDVWAGGDSQATLHAELSVEPAARRAAARAAESAPSRQVESTPSRQVERAPSRHVEQ